MYGFIWRAQEPVETYHAIHQAVVDLVGADAPAGLLVHLAYAADTGYTLVEVWESKEQSDAFTRDVVSQALQSLGIPVDGPPPDVTEFEPVEVITPQIHTPAGRA
jgi:hypothetical protein